MPNLYGAWVSWMWSAVGGNLPLVEWVVPQTWKGPQLIRNISELLMVTTFMTLEDCVAWSVLAEQGVFIKDVLESMLWWNSEPGKLRQLYFADLVSALWGTGMSDDLTKVVQRPYSPLVNGIDAMATGLGAYLIPGGAAL